MRVLLSFLMLILCAVTSAAQTVETIPLPAETVKVTLGWDKPLTGDPVTGYEIVFANTIQNGAGNTGQQIKTIPINDPTALSIEVDNAMLPTVKEFYASIRAVSGSLKSVHSNALLFRRATPPSAPGNFRGVVAVVQASLGKPESGDVMADSWIRMWEGSTHVIEPLASSFRSSSLTVSAEHGFSLSNPVPPGKSDSPTSSTRQR